MKVNRERVCNRLAHVHACWEIPGPRAKFVARVTEMCLLLNHLLKVVHSRGRGHDFQVEFSSFWNLGPGE